MKSRVSPLGCKNLTSKENKPFKSKNSKISKGKLSKAALKSKNGMINKALNMHPNMIKPKAVSKSLAYNQYMKSKGISNNMDSGKESGDRCRKDSLLQPSRPQKKM